MTAIAAAILHAQEQEVIATLRVFGAGGEASAIPRKRLLGLDAAAVARLSAHGIIVPVGDDRLYLSETALAASHAGQARLLSRITPVFAAAAMIALGLLLSRVLG